MGQRIQAGMQSWTTISPPAKHHLIGVSLMGQLIPAFTFLLEWDIDTLKDFKNAKNEIIIFCIQNIFCLL